MLTEEQHGFLQFRLCETQLIVTIHDLANGYNPTRLHALRLLAKYPMATSVLSLITSGLMDYCIISMAKAINKGISVTIKTPVPPSDCATVVP